MRRRRAATGQPSISIAGLFLTGPGERDQRKFFDEMIPALDAATADALHLASIGEPAASGANFKNHFIDGRVKKSVGTLSGNWARNVERWRDANIAVAEQVELALSQFGIQRAELPCIVFPFANDGKATRVVLSIPPVLFADAGGRAALADALLGELSAERVNQVMRGGGKRRTATAAERWASHVSAATRRLRTMADRIVQRSRTSATDARDTSASSQPTRDLPRLVVGTRARTVQLDGVDYAVSQQAWVYVKTLAEHSPGWIKASSIPGMKRPRDARKRLPSEILDVIEFGRMGHRLTIRAEVAQ